MRMQVRKLLPESWGFFCPVHTPDGSPCGLLNHFTALCRVVTHPPPDPQRTDRAVVETLIGGSLLTTTTARGALPNQPQQPGVVHGVL